MTATVPPTAVELNVCRAALSRARAERDAAVRAAAAERANRRAVEATLDEVLAVVHLAQPVQADGKQDGRATINDLKTRVDAALLAPRSIIPPPRSPR